jgi:hypothetical protein
LRRNCLLKHVIERKKERKKEGRKVEVKGRGEIKRKRLLDDLKETSDTGNCKRKH